MDIATKALESTAEFSECKKHRYDLVRHFESGHGILNFILLNPSTATAQFNDPTIARCENYTLRHTYKTLVITNLFSWRDTSPKNMMASGKAGGTVNGDPKNIDRIIEHACNAKTVICGWGNHGQFQERSMQVTSTLHKANIRLFFLECNKSGEPKHPLYIAANRSAKPMLCI